MAFKRTDEEDCEVCPYMLTRVGEADLVKKVDEREVKLELEEAKAVEEASRGCGCHFGGSGVAMRVYSRERGEF
ncbi:hypothetical protein SADUNF_Sadunf06G0043900 [Salix dunnii]|uniref:Uncharacterized protein n=1 Tax=Salix dunnii TaxID=1413687 RepID=A0A835K5F6_9ROSI|nr:hypothetical protein SADUNF_Sadunf06G0043900 [Salix dunnii]